MASTASSNFFRHWFRVEIIPIYCVTAVAVGGATWYLSRLARGPDVIWDRINNPEPWNNIDQNTQVKLIAINQKFDKRYSRFSTPVRKEEYIFKEEGSEG